MINPEPLLAENTQNAITAECNLLARELRELADVLEANRDAPHDLWPAVIQTLRIDDATAPRRLSYVNTPRRGGRIEVAVQPLSAALHLKRQQDAAPIEVIEAPPVQLKKIVSGGQDGVERLVLAAAKAAGLETGGFMLKGFSDGKYEVHPERAEEYGLLENKNADPSMQTRKNLALADGSLWLMDGRGFMVAASVCLDLGKPYMRLEDWEIYDSADLNAVADDIQQWINENKIETLHISGRLNLMRDEAAQKPVRELLNALFARQGQKPQ